MTSQRLTLRASGGRPAVQSCHFTDVHLWSLSDGPRVCEGRRAHQVIRNHAEPDPPSGAVSASIATAPQAMPSFDHTDAAFAADAPPLPSTKPALTFMRPPRGCFAARPRQDDPSHPAGDRRGFIGGRCESTIARRDVGWSIKHGDMPIERGDPQRRIGRPPIVHLVGGDDLEPRRPCAALWMPSG
jgi:hypothetical protein